MTPYLPTLPQLSRETLAVIIGTLLAAYFISRSPTLKKLVSEGSVTVKT